MQRKHPALIVHLWISGAILALVAASPSVLADGVPAAWVASADVYKVMKEDDNFRIVRATWQPGQRDKPHSHKPLGVYFVTSCDLRIYEEGGKVRDAHPKAGGAFLQKPVREHSVENIGGAVCENIIFEEK